SGSGGVSSFGTVTYANFSTTLTADFSFSGITIDFTLLNSPSPGVHNFTLTAQNDPSFYSSGLGFSPQDFTLMALTPFIPEPAAIVLIVPFLTFATRRRCFRR